MFRQGGRKRLPPLQTASRSHQTCQDPRQSRPKVWPLRNINRSYLCSLPCELTVHPANSVGISDSFTLGVNDGSSNALINGNSVRIIVGTDLMDRTSIRDELSDGRFVEIIGAPNT